MNETSHENSKEVLWEYILSYRDSNDKELFSRILEDFYEPYRHQRESLYKSNLEMLKDYPHYCNNVEQNGKLTNFLLWQDSELVLYADAEGMIKGWNYSPAEEEISEKEQVLMVVNELWDTNLEYLDNATKIKHPMMNEENPLYAVYDFDIWQVLLQTLDLKPLIEKDRVVFLVGSESCQAYFRLPHIKFPVYCIGKDSTPYRKITEQTFQDRILSYEEDAVSVKEYYAANKEQIIQNIKSGHPSILSFTDHFNTAHQYHTRDCCQAAERLGCRAEVFQTKTRLENFILEDCCKIIKDFCPDIIFLINKFRFEYEGIIPPECIVVTWIQDPFEYVMDPKTVKKLAKNDFILNHFTDWEEFFALGYSDFAAVIDAPVPANEMIYKKYPLTEDERRMYSADIALVCHALSLEDGVKEICSDIDDELTIKLIRSIISDYYREVYQTGSFIYSKGAFKTYVQTTFSSYVNGEAEVNESFAEWLAEKLFLMFNQRIFRRVLVDWLLDAGYTSLKLWGNGWGESEKYKPYAMGPAENGAVLSKIYQCSKINLGNNIVTTAAARAWECMLSGAFYMSNYIPREDDITDIRRILSLGEDVACFRNKEDLLNKIDYYLSHEEERQEMIKRGQEIALEKMTYKSLMKKTIDEIGRNL